jgi:membrane protein
MRNASRPNPVFLAALAIVGLLLPRTAEAPGTRSPDTRSPGARTAARRSSGGHAGSDAAADRDEAPRHPDGTPKPDQARGGDADPSGSPNKDELGQQAGSPAQIPPTGWWAVLKRSAAGFGEDRIMAEAASVTYYALLALFPALASLISIYGLVADPSQLGKEMAGLQGVVPGGGLDILNEQIHALTSSNHKALGLGAIVGLLVSLWSANAGVKSLFDALNEVYHEKEKRSFIRLNLVSLSFTLGGIVFLVVALTAVVVLPVVLKFIGLDSLAEWLLTILRWPLMLVVVAAGLSLIYRYGPSRTRPRWQWVSWGGTAAAIGWIVGSLLFSFYVSHFGSYNKTYGSLGAVIGFMTWIWISSIVVLMGAELNSELEQQTARDSTVGPDRPAGERGARAADTHP